MRMALLALLAATVVLGLADTGAAPTVRVCVSSHDTVAVLLRVATDPEPDVVDIVDAVVDAKPVC